MCRLGKKLSLDFWMTTSWLRFYCTFKGQSNYEKKKKRVVIRRWNGTIPIEKVQWSIPFCSSCRFPGASKSEIRCHSVSVGQISVVLQNVVQIFTQRNTASSPPALKGFERLSGDPPPSHMPQLCVPWPTTSTLTRTRFPICTACTTTPVRRCVVESWQSCCRRCQATEIDIDPQILVSAMSEFQPL